MGKKNILSSLIFKYENKSIFSVGGREGAKQSCTACRGHGIQLVTRQIGPNMMQRMQQVCKDCSGEGEIINERDRCKTCHGKKTMDQKKKLEIVISPGKINL
jgi:DnaJ-class molecular chaperone